MNRVVKLQLEAAENRRALAALLDVEDRSDEQTRELETRTAKARSLDSEIAAAMAAEPEPETRQVDAGDRELRSMIDRATVASIFEAALEHRQTDGVERELQEHYRLQGNQVPLALLEQRAVTPAPGNVGQNQAAIIPMVFPDSAAAFLGVDMPTVGVGEQVFPVLTSGATAQTPAKNAAINPTDDTGAFSAEVLSPSRLQTSFLYSREDPAKFAGMDAALRQNLSDALADGLDKAVIAGTNGLLTGTNLPNHNVTTVTTFALFLSQLAYGRVDGKYAGMTSDLTPLASKQRGSLVLEDRDDALSFRATLPPEGERPSWMVDTVMAFRAGLIGGISPGFAVPPASAVPNAEELIPEDGNPGVAIRLIRAAVLFELSLVTRPAYGGTELALRDFAGVQRCTPPTLAEKVRLWL